MADGDYRAAFRAPGARPQRLLWASTGAKNPAYSELLYVDSLVGPDTVNTMPPATYEAFRDQGVVEDRLSGLGEEARRVLDDLERAGVALAPICERLEREAVAAFEKAFDNLLRAIGEKTAALSA